MKKLRIVFITALLVLSLTGLGVLRFWNLGYSEYSPDETTVMSPIKHHTPLTVQYLASQRKGPVQLIVAKFVNLIESNPDNEFAYRLPFAIASVLGLLCFYLAIKQYTGNFYVAYISMMILGVNGFIVAFGRVVQYQNFNLLFSSLGLLFYSRSNNEKQNDTAKIFNLTLGIVFLFLSLASHWDVLFILPLVAYSAYKFYQQNKENKVLIKKVVKLHLQFLGFVIVPFFLVYFLGTLLNAGNTSYFNGRIGFTWPSVKVIIEKFNEYRFKTELYNPFYYWQFVLGMAAIGLLSLKRSWYIFLTLIFSSILFIFFVKKPGTHLYNVFLLLSLMGGYGFWVLSKIFWKFLVVIPFVAFLAVIGYFGYQNYLVFIDNSVEYPWEQEKIYAYKTVNITPKYDHVNLTNNLIGFPLRRHWVDINNAINADIAASNSPHAYTFISNDVKSISSYYIDVPYKRTQYMYAVGVKNPFSFESDYSFPQYHSKNTIAKLNYGKNLTVRIFKIELTYDPSQTK